MTPAGKASKAHAYTVDGVTWLSVSVRWQGEQEYTVSVELAVALGGPVVKPVSWPALWSGTVKFEVENTLLIEINQDEQPVSAAVSNSGPLRFLDFHAFG
jgi:hypothetical protein